jgi:hypothetical protein
VGVATAVGGGLRLFLSQRLEVVGGAVQLMIERRGAWSGVVDCCSQQNEGGVLY